MRRSPAARRVGTNGFLRLALRCARNVHDATDRRMPEAQVLANWLGQNAAALGLAEAAVPDDDALHRANAAVSRQDWRKIDVALKDAARRLPDVGRRSIAGLGRSPRPFHSIGWKRIFGLALQYRVDQRIEKLFDCLSECRGRPTRLHRDAALIALLLNASSADVDSRLAPDGKLQASGLLHVERDGNLEALGGSRRCCAGTFRRKPICTISCSEK